MRMNKDKESGEHFTNYEKLKCVNYLHRNESILEKEVCAISAENAEGECLLYAK